MRCTAVREARDLQRAGRQLRRALELAIRKGDAAAHADAWRLANDAISTVGQVQSRSREDLAVAVRLASERLESRQYPAVDRDAKRAARIKTGLGSRRARERPGLRILVGRAGLLPNRNHA
jgi:hypothetical protein